MGKVLQLGVLGSAEISTCGQYDDLHKNGKNYNIENYSLVKKQRILAQLVDLTN